MGKLLEAIEEKVYDVRNINKNLNSNRISKAEFDKSFVDLTDESENCEEIDLDDEIAN